MYQIQNDLFTLPHIMCVLYLEPGTLSQAIPFLFTIYCIGKIANKQRILGTEHLVQGIV